MADATTETLLVQINAAVESLRLGMAEADKSVATFEAHTQEKLSAVDAAFERVGEHVKESAKEIATGYLAFFATERLLEFAKQGLEAAAALGEVAQQLGTTAEQVQLFRFAATQAGISTEEADKALQRFTRTLSEARAGSEKAKGVFHGLGFTDDDIKHLDAHEALLKTADGLAELRDDVARAAPEVALFGKAGQQLNPLLSRGSEGINNLAKEANDLGVVLNQDQIRNAEVTSHKLAELKDVLSTSIAGAVADDAKGIYDLIGALEQLISLGGQIGSFLDKLAGGFQADEGAIYQWYGSLVKAIGGSSALYDRGVAERKEGLDRAAGVHDKVPGAEEKPHAGTKDYTDPAAAASTARAEGEAQRNAAEAQRKAEAAVKAAEEARRKEVDREKRVADEGARLDDTYLSAKSGLTADTEEQAVIARKRLTADTEAKIADLKSQISTGQVKGYIDKDGQIQGVEAKGLADRIERNAAIEADAINQRDNVALSQQAFALANAELDNLRDILGSQTSLATTARARRDFALQQLAAEKEAERERLQDVAIDKSRTNRRYNDGDVDIANEGLRTLDQRYDLKEQVAKQANAGPLEDFKNQLQKTVGDSNEALQSLEVSAIGQMGDAFESAAAKALHLHGVLGNIIGDFLKLIEQKAELAFVGGSGGGLGGLFGGIGKLLGGSGGIDKSIDTFAFADGGRVTGPGGPRDDRVLARVSPGEFIINADAYKLNPELVEAINAKRLPRFADGGPVVPRAIYEPRIPNMAAIGASRTTTVHQHNQFNITGVSSPADVYKAAVDVVRAAQPELTNMAVAETIRQAARVKL